MTSEIGVYRTANVLIREHGPAARMEAVQRAGVLRRKGDIAGHVAWKRIAAAVDEIGRTTPRDGEPAH